jgi:hypothetical protein
MTGTAKVKAKPATPLIHSQSDASIVKTYMPYDRLRETHRLYNWRAFIGFRMAHDFTLACSRQADR